MQIVKIMSFTLLTVSFASTGFAKDVIVRSYEERADYIRSADTWQKPKWMDENLNISDSFDITKLDVKTEVDALLSNSEEIACQMTEELATDISTGTSPKFKCLVLKLDRATGAYNLALSKKGKPIKVKVKYRADNNEVVTEVLATRLLRALGFTTDRMYPAKTLRCFGCTDDPFKKRTLDTSSLISPRIFTNVAVEQKYDAEKIEIKEDSFAGAKPTEGWSYHEILGRRSYSADQAEAREQIIERDALITIGGVLHHTDDKRANHRLVCDGKVSEEGKCEGNTVIMIQDTGFTFGGQVKSLDQGKADFSKWKARNVWMGEENGRSCALNLGMSISMTIPSVTEEGRIFAARLLQKLTAGEVGRKRVSDLFKYAGIERADNKSVEQWTELFLSKVAEAAQPPQGHCRKTVESVLRKLE